MNFYKRLAVVSLSIIVLLFVAACDDLPGSEIVPTGQRLIGILTIDADPALVPVRSTSAPADSKATIKVASDVVDTMGTLPLSGVEVKIGRLTSSTDVAGAYTLSNVSEGTHDLIILFGKKELHREKVVIGDNPIETKNIHIKTGDLKLSHAEATKLIVAPPVTLNMGNPLHRQVVKKPYDYLNIEVKKDPFGDAALYFPQGKPDQAAPATGGSRFALLDFPDVNEFTFSVKSLGDPNLKNPTGVPGNNGFSFVFGYVDEDNYWDVYYSQSAGSTNVNRVVDGVHTTRYCRATEAGWSPDNENYQEIEITLTRQGNKMIYNDFVRGTSKTGPSSLDGCEIDLSDYSPGKVGVGGHATSVNMAWYYKDMTLEPR